DLGLAPEAFDVVLLVEDEVVDAALDGGGKTLVAIAGGDIVTAAQRAVDNMGGAGGGGAGLVDLQGRQEFGERRAAEGVGSPVGNSGGLDLRHRSADKFV